MLKSKLQAINVALFADRNIGQIPDCFTSDYIAHVSGDKSACGYDIIRKHLQALHRAFPKLDYKIDVLIEYEDRIAWQRTFSGVQEAAYLGFPASGKIIIWSDMVVSRFKDGLIAEEWFVTDLAEKLLLSRKK